MLQEKQEKCSSIYSNMYYIKNGTSENWQKAIGAHNVWLSAVVEKNKNKYIMYADIHFRDKYNFNRGSKDIGSGAKDEVNGRFEEIGWARSFETYGYVHIEVTWKKNIKRSKMKVYKGSDY